MNFIDQQISKAAMFGVLENIRSVDKAMSCRDVAELFREMDDVQGFAITAAGFPVGIIARNELTIRLASQYGHAVYGKRPVTDLMDKNPLIVDIEDEVEAVEQRIAGGYSQALTSGFIIVDQGRYLGMGSALSIMKKSVERTRLQNVQLAAASELAQQANKVKSQFLANMSHELRTPLNAVIGFSELIASEVYGPVTPTKYKDYARDILDSGRHLLSLINEILDMSKIEAGRFSLQEQPLEINRLVQSTVKMCQVLAQDKSIELAANLPKISPVFIADERAIKQILLNLVSNGIKYTPNEGKVSVHVDWHSDGGLVIRVTDTGVGIAENEIDVVLEPFRQAGNSMYTKTEGTGLGLAIVKALAELHDAEFKLSSNLGRGTEVSIHFPRTRIYDHCPAA